MIVAVLVVVVKLSAVVSVVRPTLPPHDRSIRTSIIRSIHSRIIIRGSRIIIRGSRIIIRVVVLLRVAVVILSPSSLPHGAVESIFQIKHIRT